MIIVIDKHIPYAAQVLSRYAIIREIEGSTIKASDIIDADALLVRTRTRCDAALLGGSRVKFVGTATIGYDHIDRAWCAANGITFASAAGCNARAVLQWVSGVLAHLAHSDGWRPEERTLGVVGVGHVGSLVADYARSWGFRVVCSDPPRELSEGLGLNEGFLPLSELAACADIVTFHPLLVREGSWPSFHLADSTFLASLHDGATVLNASRGEVLDTRAALKELHRLRFCIDTWEGEPSIDRTLLASAEVTTQHIAGYSVQGKANASAMILSALGRCFNIPELESWFPDEVERTVPRPIGWDDMCRTIGRYFDPVAESNVLRTGADRFEELRNNYNLRQEYF